MSYILDALKKSEQDRKQGEVPGLNSLQGQPRPPRSTSRTILYLLIGALVVNALLLGVWVISRQPEAPVVTADLPGPVVSKTDKPQTEDVEPQGSTEVIADAAPTITAQSPAEATAQPDPEPAGADSFQITATETVPDITEDAEPPAEDEDTPPKLIRYSDLPAEVRSDLPDLSISAHYYTDDRHARMASINGRIMRQGQSVKSGLVLDEITRKGVIFKFRKYRFSMDVFNR